MTALDPRFAFGRAVEKAPILAKARSGHSEEPSRKAARSQDLLKRQAASKESRQIHADEHHSLHQWTMGSCDGGHLQELGT